MTEQDALDMFDELPGLVKSAVLSNLLTLRRIPRMGFYDYPLPVAEYIQASGLMRVTISPYGGVTFYKNDASEWIYKHLMRLISQYLQGDDK